MSIGSFGITMADIAIIAIVALFGWLGWRKGLMGSVVGILSLIAAIILAWLLYPVVSDLLMGAGVKDYIHNQVWQKMSADATGDMNLMLPQAAAGIAEQGINAAAAETASYIAGIVLNVISFVVVLIVSIIVIKIASALLGVVSKLPVINSLNHIAGLVLGLIKGIIIVYLLLVVLLGTLPVRDSGLSEAVENSIIVKKMYNENPMANIFIKKGIDIKGQNGE